MKTIIKLFASASVGVLLAACAGTGAGEVATAAPPSGPQVTVDTGTLEGVQSEGVEFFKGIPYAAPPVGDLRWVPPKPAAAWNGVHAAKDYANDCMQQPAPGDMAPLRTTPAEDCLYLNVWRPKGGSKLPVMLWIHGGGFVNGGTSPAVYDGSKFARDGVILVSINYRLGRFGFFGFPALTAGANDNPIGNYGFMDQIAALKWVKANIAAFGGDPDNVTIFGESAGGFSVHTLLQSPMAAGLFARAIVESGGGRGNLSGDRQVSKDLPNLPSADTIGVNFAKANGIEGTDDAALKALRALPAETVVNGLMMATMGGAGGPLTYGGPVVDGKLVTTSPETAYTSGKFNKVPLMAGANSADIGFGMARTVDEAVAPFGPQNKKNALAAYDEKGTGNVLMIAMKAGMDRMMIEPARFAVQAFAANGLPSYEYRFSYVAPAAAAAMAKNPMLNMVKDNKELIDFVTKNAQHASEIPYAFETVTAAYGSDTTDADVAMAKSAHRYWVNFAKTGNPSTPSLDNANPAWPVYDAKSDVLLNFTQDGAKAMPDPLKARLDLTAARKN
jgi:para-nitrobenzyl esterase